MPGAARDWIASQMRGFASNALQGSNVTVSLPSYVQAPVAGLFVNATPITDIALRIEGTSKTNRMYVVTGHYDSRVTSILNNVDDAPGADDDASGVAVIMELARIFSQHVCVSPYDTMHYESLTSVAAPALGHYDFRRSCW
jgi:Zn-dependent M28 family amino/carboxypeptidase